MPMTPRPASSLFRKDAWRASGEIESLSTRLQTSAIATMYRFAKLMVAG
ncbi:MAG TPA: hypothetical protein VM008_19890 [Phycisphaerae bacterium]|nr:hypothetical protein [Phycisphaerae bacterium]